GQIETRESGHLPVPLHEPRRLDHLGHEAPFVDRRLLPRTDPRSTSERGREPPGFGLRYRSISLSMSWACSPSSSPSSVTRLADPPARIEAGIASAEPGLELGRPGLGPAQHPHRAQGIPSARLALAIVDLEVQLAGMGVLERPSALGVALGPDDVDRL